MKKTWTMILTSVVAGAAGLALRIQQLRTMVDAQGKLEQGAGKGLLTWLCLAVAVLFALYACFCKKKDIRTQLTAREAALRLIAAVLMLMGAALRFEQERLTAICGVLAGILLAADTMGKKEKTAASAVMPLLAVLCLVVQLVAQFRDWSRDPAILDYCFDLFALICLVASVLHTAGNRLGYVHRKMPLFFGMSGVLFNMTALPGGGTVKLLIGIGSTLWLLAGLPALLEEAQQQ